MTERWTPTPEGAPPGKPHNYALRLDDIPAPVRALLDDLVDDAYAGLGPDHPYRRRLWWRFVDTVRRHYPALIDLVEMVPCASCGALFAPSAKQRRDRLDRGLAAYCPRGCRGPKGGPPLPAQEPTIAPRKAQR